MRRAGNLFERLIEPGNLVLAYLKARRGKSAKSEVREYGENLAAELSTLRRRLIDGLIGIGVYRFFKVRDPKERDICAAPFRERVLHHALMNVCESVLERSAIADSYACRKGKGSHAAVERAQSFARRNAWFLKLDIAKFFDSVDHAILEAQLARVIKDRRILALFGRILESYETAPGKGIPIGNLTSQHFANFHLGHLDRFVKETLRRPAYLRYMDDFVVFGGSREELRGVLLRVRDYLRDALRLSLHPAVLINRTACGFDFLGFRVFPGRIRLSRRSRRRFAEKLRRCEHLHVADALSEAALARHVEPLVAFTRHADAGALRKSLIRCIQESECEDR